MTDITKTPEFTNEAAAVALLESSRWPDGATCPHCGSDNVMRMGGKTQAGYWLCRDCRDKFTARTGSVMERSHIPVHKWLLAIHLMNSSKKGMSAHQLHRMLGVTYKSAWFLAHRIREAMRDGRLAPPQLGGPGKVVEIDETWQGKQEGVTKSRGAYQMNIVLSLVERGGPSRTFHVSGTTVGTLLPILRANINRETTVMTDDASWYRNLRQHFAGHETVNHSEEEYVRREWREKDDVSFEERIITTNTVEGFFSIFKRGMKGVYQHCSEKHLHRYVAEFNFRYANRIAVGVTDKDRAALALKGIAGKRLTYRRPDKAAHV